MKVILVYDDGKVESVKCTKVEPSTLRPGIIIIDEGDRVVSIDNVVCVVEDVRNTTVQNRGEWIPYDKTGTNNFDDFKCSQCGRVNSYKSNFCPVCGANMIEED